MLDASFSQNDSNPYPLVYRNLMAVCLLGAMHKADEDVNGKVGKAVERTLVDPGKFRVYRALAQSMGGNGAAAMEALVAHLEKHPDDDGAKLALAVAKMTTGDSGCKPMLENVLATTSDPGAREAANGLLEYLKSHS